MKERSLIQDNTANRISYYHLAFFAASLPFNRLYSELALISLLVHQLLHMRQYPLRSIRWRDVLLLSPVYLLTVAGTLYTAYHGEAFYEWERQLALLLFPLMPIMYSIDLKKYLLPVLTTMAVSCACTILYLYLKAAGTLITLHLPWQALFSQAFMNHSFAAPVDMHATYFSMYIALSFAAMLYCCVRCSGRVRWLYICLLLVLGAGLLQLSSRAVLIAMGIVMNIAAPLLLFSKRSAIQYLLCSLALTAVLAFAVIRVDAWKQRLLLQLKDDLTEAAVRTNTLEPRIQRWERAWELIRQSPVYGHGSGSEVALLKERYFETGMYHAYLNELNAHNQYLGIAVKTGLTGLLVFLVTLAVYFYRAITTRDFLFCSFLLIVCAVFFSENVLDANKGIFFYAFFLSFFFFSHTPARQRRI